eukprot:GHVL01038916.1.p1 GENE.GHVL01038916.1~~GHVL01038916.1.p1  ORF type:complete len:811 (-),score=183.39 GHVL01038916.1:1736-4168(-)
MGRQSSCISHKTPLKMMSFGGERMTKNIQSKLKRHTTFDGCVYKEYSDNDEQNEDKNTVLSCIEKHSYEKMFKNVEKHEPLVSKSILFTIKLKVGGLMEPDEADKLIDHMSNKLLIPRNQMMLVALRGDGSVMDIRILGSLGPPTAMSVLKKIYNSLNSGHGTLFQGLEGIYFKESKFVAASLYDDRKGTITPLPPDVFDYSGIPMHPVWSDDMAYEVIIPTNHETTLYYPSNIKDKPKNPTPVMENSAVQTSSNSLESDTKSYQQDSSRVRRVNSIKHSPSRMKSIQEKNARATLSQCYSSQSLANSTKTTSRSPTSFLMPDSGRLDDRSDELDSLVLKDSKPTRYRGHSPPRYVEGESILVRSPELIHGRSRSSCQSIVTYRADYKSNDPIHTQHDPSTFSQFNNSTYRANRRKTSFKVDSTKISSQKNVAEFFETYYKNSTPPNNPLSKPLASSKSSDKIIEKTTNLSSSKSNDKIIEKMSNLPYRRSITTQINSKNSGPRRVLSMQKIPHPTIVHSNNQSTYLTELESNSLNHVNINPVDDKLRQELRVTGDEELTEIKDQELAKRVDEMLAERADEEQQSERADELTEVVDDELTERADEELAERPDVETGEGVEEELAKCVEEETAERPEEALAGGDKEETAERAEEELSEGDKEETAERAEEELSEGAGTVDKQIEDLQNEAFNEKSPNGHVVRWAEKYSGSEEFMDEQSKHIKNEDKKMSSLDTSSDNIKSPKKIKWKSKEASAAKKIANEIIKKNKLSVTTAMDKPSDDPFWIEVSQHVGSRTPEECKQWFNYKMDKRSNK